MITLSNGHAFKYMVASGALAFDGKGWPWERPLVWLGLIKPELFTVVIKSLTRNPRVGNLRWWKPWTCVRLIPGGSVNKVGLTNPGIEWWCKEVGPKLDFQKFPTAGSIFGDEKELVEMAEMLNRFDLVALEVNVSCPNTCGGEPFVTADRLDALLARLDAIETRKPTFLKLPADLSTIELDAIVAVCDNHRVQGLILSNLTKKRDRATIDSAEIAVTDKGGISGKPSFDPSNELISHLWKTTGRRYVIVGTGGIFSAEDAYEKIVRGASLVQLITGMIFEGPQLIGEINRGLVRLLRRDGFKSIGEAVGTRD